MRSSSLDLAKHIILYVRGWRGMSGAFRSDLRRIKGSTKCARAGYVMARARSLAPLKNAGRGMTSHKLVATFLRRKFIDRAVVGGPSMDGGAVEVAEGIDDHSVVGKSWVRCAGKAIGHAFGPGAGCFRGHLEDDATTAASTAVAGGAVKIAGRVGDQGADGTAAVRAAFEAVEHGFGPGVGAASQFVDRADVVGAGIIGGSVEVAGFVENHSAVGQSSVGLIFKGIERFQLPLALRERQFENRSIAIGAAHGSGSVDISRGVKDQASGGTAGSVIAAGEGVKHAQAPAAGALFELIDDALSFCAAGGSCAVEVAVLVECHSASRPGAVVAPGEGVDDALRPSSTGVGEFIGYAASAFAGAGAARNRGSVEIALSIERDAFVGLAAVGSAGEVVENGVDAGGRDFKHRTSAEGSTLNRGAVDVAGGIGDEVAV